VIAAFAAPLVERDFASIQAIIREAVRERGLAHLAVTDPRGNVIAAQGWTPDLAHPRDEAVTPIEGPDGSRRISFQAEIRLGEQLLGHAHFGLSYEPDLDGTGGWLMTSLSGSSLVVESGIDGVATQSARLSGVDGGSYSMESGEHFPYGPSDFWPDYFSSAVSARICSTELGGCLDVVNDPPFVLGEYDYYPASGKLRVSDDAGHFVEVTATSAAGAVTVTYDIGAGVQGPFATTWICLDAVDSTGCFVQ